MNELRKVLVVDDGARTFVDPLSAELGELGLSTVTTSFEAAEDVLRVIEMPSAIILKMPEGERGEVYDRFLGLADQLRTGAPTAGIPVVVWDRSSAFVAGGISAVLQSRYGQGIFAPSTV